MRTTLTLDPDVARMLEEEAHRQRKPFKHVVNEAIRRGLTPRAPGRHAARYQVRPHKTTLRPGIDDAALNQLADELEDEAIIDKMRTGR
jgi:predicted transcriptional regulator